MHSSGLQEDIDALLSSGSPASRFAAADNTLAFSLSLNSSQEDIRIVCLFEDLRLWPNSPLLSVHSHGPAYEPMRNSLMDLAEKSPPYNLQSLIERVVKACGMRSEDGSRHRRALSYGVMSMDEGSDSEGNNHADEEDMGEAADYGNDEEEEQENYDDDQDKDEEEDEEEREMMVELGRRQGRWDKFEDLHAAKVLATGLSPLETLAKKQQIFEPRESFIMLSKDMLSIIRKQKLDLFVDSLGDDVYTWTIEMGQFDPVSPLAKDMLDIQKRHSYSYVSLVIRFKRGLHPFYPPGVEVIRPHFKGCLSAALASHPMMKLGSWDPTMPMELMLSHIKSFLEHVARVDLNHPRNSVSNFPDSAYEPLEVLLARLNALSGLPLPCKPLSVLLSASGKSDPLSLYASYDKEAERMELMKEAAESGKKRKKEQEEAKPGQAKAAVWARGTGYGYGDSRNQEVWDIKASEVTQAARDEELRALVEQIAKEISCASASKVEEGEGSSMQVDLTPSKPSSSSSSSSSLDMLTTLSESCIVPFLLGEVHSRLAFTEMCARAPLYLALTDLILAMASYRSPHAASPGNTTASSSSAGQEQQKGSGKEGLVSLLLQGSNTTSSEPSEPSTSATASEGNASLASNLALLLPSARQFAKITSPIFLEDQKLNKDPPSSSAAATPNKALAQKELETRQEMADGMTLADRIERIVSLLPKDQALNPKAPKPSSCADDPYQATMRPLQLDYTPSLVTLNHTYQSLSDAECVKPRPRVTRLAREMSGLLHMLPMDAGSSIFVRVDESQCTIWRALITGPEDTPYSAGCFVFDIYFPSSYPSIPPQVTFKTTGGGRIRFNPNLYNNGKVCLSLLGTWEGGKGEGWNAQVSTAIQVLLSIQSLILVPEPYYNEPGHERQGSEPQSKEYNRAIEVGTLRWAMLDILQHPPKELKDVICNHFRLRKQFIIDQTNQWIEKAGSPHHATELRSLLDQLLPLMEKLK